MGTPHVILVRAAYYGILLLFTGFVGALSEELFKNAAKKTPSTGYRRVRFIQEYCVVSDFVNTERRFLVVLRHIVIRYGDLWEYVPRQPVHGTLATLRASLVSSVSPYPVARSSKVRAACLE